MYTGKYEYNHNLINGYNRNRIHDTTLYMPNFGKGKSTSQIILTDNSSQITNTEYVCEKIDEYMTYIQNKLNEIDYWFDGEDNSSSIIATLKSTLTTLESTHATDYNMYLASLNEIKAKLDWFQERITAIKTGRMVYVETSTPGTYSIRLNNPNGKYRITVVSAGGGGAAQGDTDELKSTQAGGGSGAYVSGIWSLPIGDYTYTVGSGGYGSSWKNGEETYDGGTGPKYGGTGGTSSFSNLIVCSGGTGGYAEFKYLKAKGIGGKVTTCSSGSSVSSSNGNDGIEGGSGMFYVSGGASVYGGFGVGGWGQAIGHNLAKTGCGGNGYIKISAVEN